MVEKRKTQPKQKPAIDPAAREKQLINLAVNLAEKQLADGTASPSVINHYLKLASTRESIEREILHNQAQLISAKTSALEANKQHEAAVQEAIDAMRSYAPTQ